MPPEAAKLLWDMLQAGRRIQRFTANKSFDACLADDLLRSGVERQFGIIGEALSQLAKKWPEVATRLTGYRKIISLRNVLIHGYDVIDDETSWDIVQHKLPVLLAE